MKKFDPQKVDDDTLNKLNSVTDELLKTLITMSSALLAIGVVFDDIVKAPVMRLVIILMFFLGLIISFLGVLPINIRYDIESAEELRKQQIRSFRRKRRHLWLSAAAIAVSIILIIFDLLVDVFKSTGTA